jgi:RNA polymerase sigma-70 factor (ECF subfamily)
MVSHMKATGSITSVDMRAPRLFPETLWSVVLKAKREDGDAALSRLLPAYRGPLFGFLQSLGYDYHTASDHLQSFFEHLLRRSFLENVGREKGRFRTFLICSLKHYLRDQWQREVATKRGGGRYIESLEAADSEGKPLRQAAAAGPSPDVEFDRAWARRLLSKALDQLEQECVQAGRGALFMALRQCIQADPGAPSYLAVGQRLGMTEGAVKVAVHRLKGRLGQLVRDEVMQTVEGKEEW